MPSLGDLSAVYAPSGRETGFILADIARQRQEAESGATLGRERVLRNFNQFDLPSLNSQQAARGAFQSSATNFKRNQLSTGSGDSLTDIARQLASTKGRLATNALLAKTGIQLGGGY